MSPTPEPAPITSRHVARGVGTTLLSRAGNLIEIVAQPLYVAMFGLASFGLYTVLWAAVNLAENIFDLGMTSALQRVVPQAKDEAASVAALRAALIMGVGPNLLVAILASLFADDIALLINVAAADRHLVAPAIRLFAWALPLWAFVEIATSALRARHLFGAEIRLRLVWEQIIRLAMAAALFGLGFGLTGLFIAHLTSLGMTALLSLRLLARHYRLALLFKRAEGNHPFIETTKAGLSVLPSNIAARAFSDAPPIILNMLLPGATGAASAALYTIARKIASVVQMVSIALNYVLAPLASSAKRNDMAQVHGIYAYAVRLITATALPMAVLLSAFAPLLLRLFGSAAESARWAVTILLTGRAIEAIVGTAQPVMQVVGGYRRQMLASMIGISVAVAAGALLVPHFQLTGMAIAVALGLATTAVVPMVQLHVHDGIQPFDRTYPGVLGWALMISAPAFAVGLLVARLPDPIAIALILPVTLAAIWACLRFALPVTDRISLGRKTVRRLRLLPAGDMPPT